MVGLEIRMGHHERQHSISEWSLRPTGGKEKFATRLLPSAEFVPLEAQTDLERMKTIRLSLDRLASPIDTFGLIFADEFSDPKPKKLIERVKERIAEKLPPSLRKPYKTTRALRWTGRKIPLLEGQTEQFAKRFGTSLEKADAYQPFLDRQVTKGRITNKEALSYRQGILQGEEAITHLFEDWAVSSTANVLLGKPLAIASSFALNSLGHPEFIPVVIAGEMFSGPPAVPYFIKRAFEEIQIAKRQIDSEQNTKVGKAIKLTGRVIYHLGVSPASAVPFISWIAAPLMTLPRQEKLGLLLATDIAEQTYAETIGKAVSTVKRFTKKA